METISREEANRLSSAQNEYHLMILEDGLFLGTLKWVDEHWVPTPIKKVVEGE